MVKLGEVVTIDNGYAFKSSKYVDSGIRVIRITNVQKGRIEDEDPKFYPVETEQELSKYLIKENDILMSLTGNVGRVGKFPKHLLPAFLNQRVCKISKISSDVDRGFLFHLLNSDKFENEAIHNSSGVAQLNLSTNWLKDYEINFPPLPTQQKIAAILDEADKLRQLNKQLIAKYDALTQSLFLEMFGDPVTNPMGWEKVRLNKLCSFSKRTIKPEAIKNGTKYLGLECIEKETGKIVEIFSVGEGELKSNKFWFDNTYILYGKLRPYLNKVALPSFEGICSTDIIPIKPYEKVSNKFFISQIMKESSFVAFADERSSGANLPRISPSEVEKYQTINPPFQLQNQFAERVQAIEAQKAHAQASLAKAEDLFNSLLQRAFKGELV